MSQRRNAAWAGAEPLSGLKAQWILLLGSLKVLVERGLAWASPIPAGVASVIRVVMRRIDFMELIE